MRFMFNQDWEAVTEEDNSGLNRLIRASELIAANSGADSARTYYHYACDEMGSTTHIVDEAGAVQNCYEYDAWGNITAQEEAIPNRFKFTGQQFDPVTQQYYLRARFYNPIVARFTQEDTYRGDGLNLYAYCANNSTYYTDPSGNQPQCVKDAAARYMSEGMSKEDAYRRAYAEHAQRKLDDPDLSPRERAVLEQRQDRLNQPSKPQASPEISTGASGGTSRRDDDLTPLVHKVDPNEIRFSQSSVNGAKEIIDSMRASGWKGAAIDVVTMPDGRLTTVDNTRVVAARHAGIEVDAVIHKFDEALPSDMVERFTTPRGGTPTTWGDAVIGRINNQNKGFRSTHPYGSQYTGWSGN